MSAILDIRLKDPSNGYNPRLAISRHHALNRCPWSQQTRVFRGSHQTSNNAGARIALNGRPICLPRLEASKRGVWTLRGQGLEQVAHNS
jgi:hypothetical protein